jgi:hypothetical protein
MLMAGGVGCGSELTGSLLSASETEVCLALNTELPERVEVGLTIEGLGQTRPVRLLGSIAWCRPSGGKWVTSIHLSGAAWLPHYLQLTSGAVA